MRHFGEGHPVLRLHLQQVSWSEIALPSVVVAEVLRGRCDFALKARPSQMPLAHSLLIKTQTMINQFNLILFSEEAAFTLEKMKERHKTHKRYADFQISAMAKAGGHIVVTRNLKHFSNLLPKNQLQNWIDDKP